MTDVELMNVFKKLTGKAESIMESKNKDYRGGTNDPFANFKGSSAFGIHPVIGILLRMQDKMMRVKTYTVKGRLHVANEGLEDALVDIINYAVLIGGMCEDGKNSKALSTGLSEEDGTGHSEDA